MKKILLLSLFSFLATFIGFGQNKKKQNSPPPITSAVPVPAPKPVEKILNATEVLNDFYTNLNTYFTSPSPNLDQVTKHLSADFLFVRNTENVDGKIKSVRWNTEETMRDIKATKDLNIKASRTINKIVFNQTVNNLANISAVVHLKYIQDTTVLADVYAFSTHTLVNENGSWKILNILTDRVAESQYIGSCPCKITRTMAERNDLFTAKVMYPNGSSFETEEQSITFKEQGPITVITVGSNYYTWKENIVYTAKVDGNTTPEIVGKATNNSEAIMLVLAKSTYKKNCARFEPIK
jgi:hypothetical protein